MKFQLIDNVLERSDDRIVAAKVVTRSEEYLDDHFPTFPILPGVFMLEAMAQAARELLAHRGDPRLVLGSVKALKYGAMVKPGHRLVVEVNLKNANPDGTYDCRGTGTVFADSDANGETAVSGRFTMRPIKTTGP